MSTGRDPRFLLMYSPQRFDSYYGSVKPEATLGLLYLAGALRRELFDVEILDACVGNDRYSMEESFLRQTPLPNGMIRVGMAPEAILREVSQFDVIGISGVFTVQTRMAEEVIRLIAQAYPDKLIITGGINARSQMSLFFDAGVHIICISEAERTIVEIGQVLRNGNRDFSNVSGIAFRYNGKIQVNPPIVEVDLDKLPIPAWDLLALKRMWKIARPHGGMLTRASAYVSANTSRGCPYQCTFCHISKETEGSISGNLRQFREKSLERVRKEMDVLKDLGVKYVFIEDDSLLANKKRALAIFKMLVSYGFKLGDVNGVNLSHLVTNVGDGRLAVDKEMLEAMAEAGFFKLAFPVESGSQRILDKYVSGKVNLTRYNISEMIRVANSYGIEVASVYLIGYPDETYEELAQTLILAKKHRDAGSNYVNLTMVTPFPGTLLYDMVMREDLLLPGVEIADLDWMRPSMKTLIDPWYLEFISKRGWEYLNNPERIATIRSMAPMAPSKIE